MKEKTCPRHGYSVAGDTVRVSETFAPDKPYMHYLDSARVICMLVGVPYHAAHIYENEKNWWVHSSSNSWVFDIVISFSNSFRMAAFFMVAGLLSALVIDKAGLRPWGRSRAVRLAVPLISAFLALQLLQMYLASEAVGREFFSFWKAEFANRPRLNIFHLWFIPTLMILSVTLGAVFQRRGKAAFSRQHPFAKLMAGIILLNIAFYIVANILPRVAGLYPHFLWGLIDLRKSLYYLAPFFVGAKLFWDPAFREQFLRLNPHLAIIGTTAFVVFSIAREGDSFMAEAVRTLAQPIAAICLSQALIALCFRYLNRPNVLTKRFSASAYSIYLFHHPVVMALGIAFLSIGLNIFLEYALIVAAAFVVPYVLHRFAIARSQTLSFIFNGERRTRPNEAISGRHAATG